MTHESVNELEKTTTKTQAHIALRAGSPASELACLRAINLGNSCDPMWGRNRDPAHRALSASERAAVLAELLLRALRRQLAGARSRRRCSTRAATSPRSARCTGSSRPSTARSASAATRCAIPAYARPELLAERPERALELGHHEAARPGEVDLLLPVRDPRRVQPLRRRLDGPAPRERRARQGADRPSRSAAAGHARAVHPPRRPRQLDDLKARRLPARRSRRDQDPLPAPHLDRQPLLRSAVQDAQVPARLPANASRASSTRGRSAATSSAGTTTSTATAGSGLLTPATVHHGRAESDARRPQRRARRRLRREARALRPPARPRRRRYRPPRGSTSPTPRRPSLNPNADCLIPLHRSAVPATSWLEGVLLDRSGFILTDTDLPETQPRDSFGLLGRQPLAFETSIPGLFAAGDVRHGSMKRIAAAVGEGSSAIRSVHQAIGK